MSKNSSMDLRMTVYVALFTALIIIGGYLSVPIPVGPVPIVLADFFIMLTGLFLGKKWGLCSVVLYLFLGAIGLPVFAGGKAGLAVIIGPTGGFLFGYLALVFAIGLISGMGKPSFLKNLAALIVGNVFLYVFGVPWLKVVAHFTWAKAVAAGLIPFIPGIIIKVTVALILAQVLVPRFKQTLTASSNQSNNVEG